jgi:DegV family protein with EDD domain
MPTTSQVNPDEAIEHFRKIVGISKNILCLVFSSGLSGTCNSFMMAARELMEEDESINIRVVDTLSASMGQGLMVYKAVCLKEQGKSLNEVADYIEAHIKNFTQVFTVDDLDHLYRGGRLSKTAAVVGSMINLKPVLHITEEGRLENMFNVRGRKKSLHALVDYMEKTMGSYREENDIVFISHADNKQDAEFVAEEIRKRFGIEKFMINEIGPTIGSHTGPDVIAVFFMGENR